MKGIDRFSAIRRTMKPKQQRLFLQTKTLEIPPGE